MEQNTEKEQISSANETTPNTECNTSTTSQTDEKVYTSEWLKEHTDINGWLTFMLFSVMVGGVLSVILSFINYNSGDSFNAFIGLVDVAMGFVLFCIGGYTLYTFLKRKPNAVFWGCSYMILALVTNLIFLSTSAEDATHQQIKMAGRSTVWSVIWIIYLFRSKKVKEVIPPSFRRITSFDWSALALLILLPITLIFIGLTQIEAQADLHKVEEQKMLSQPLDSLQRTDGKVIFTLPEGFTCEPREVTLDDGSLFTLFDLANEEDNCNATLCSDYDTDMSKANIETYWTNWRDEETDNYESTTVTMGTSQINGSDCVYRVMKYDINSVDVYWHFYLMFNEETDKVFVASIYNTSETATYINELLESVKFQ